MGHSIGDGIIVAALAVAFLGWYYLKVRERRERLEVIHQERVVAMEKGIPLPELPLEPPVASQGRVTGQHVPLILGIILATLGGGTMITLWILGGERTLWPLPLPFALMGVGLMLYHFLAVGRPEGSSAPRGD